MKSDTQGVRAGKASRKNEKEIMVHVATNNPGNLNHLANVFEMFYRGAFDNTLGIMEALNSETGKEELVVVGIEPQADGSANLFPLAKILDMEEIVKYRSPDGKGNWLGEPTDLGPKVFDLDKAVEAINDKYANQARA